VKILFDELLLALEASALAERQGDRVMVSDKQARAMSILFALESSLDYDKGGDIAVGLTQIYREARRLLLVGAKERSAEPVDQARAIVAEIAEAWNQIG
jgi:flagellar protein FliS